MEISYKKLWHILLDKNMTKSDLQKSAKLSWGTIARLNKGENIGTDVLLKICQLLKCDIADIMEIEKTESAIPHFDTSYVKNEIQKIISAITIDDSSLDKFKIQEKIEEYYLAKFSNAIQDDRYYFIDLFCGAGGLSVGLEKAGLSPIKAVDKDLSSLRTYRFNHPWLSDSDLIHDDIRNLTQKDIFPYAPVVVGGPPCQGFSIVNKHKKDNDERNELYKFYVNVVEQVKPKIFLMENVEGILQLFDKIKDDFNKIGFLVCSPLILSPKDFGFPQSRKRAFILGINEDYQDKFDFLFTIFKNNINRFLNGRTYNLGDAISDLPILSAKTAKNATNIENASWGYTFSRMQQNLSDYSRLVNEGLPDILPLLNHKSKYNNQRDILIYQRLKPGEKSDAESIQDINPYKNRAGIFRDKFDKLIADEPCKAITAHMYYDCNMYIHPSQARGLTPREAARVQGFPDDYLFLGSPNEWYRQIGNAVSPLVAKIIGLALVKVLEKIG